MNAKRSLLSLWVGGTILAMTMSVPTGARGESLRGEGGQGPARDQKQVSLQKQERTWARSVLIEFEKTLKPSIKSSGFELIVRVDSASVSESARAERDGARAIITVDGGLLKSPRLTEDGLRTTLCHELGHVLGGAPRRHVPPEWDGPVAADGLSEMTSEGQADYYASAICFRKLVAGHDHRAVLARGEGPTSQTLKARCESAHGAKTEAALICERAARGGHNMLVLVKEFPIGFDTPSDFIAPSLIRDQYPDRQCRLDTFVAGALCSAETSIALDFNDERLTECPTAKAQRPRCWSPTLLAPGDRQL